MCQYFRLQCIVDMIQAGLWLRSQEGQGEKFTSGAQPDNNGGSSFGTSLLLAEPRAAVKLLPNPLAPVHF